MLISGFTLPALGVAPPAHVFRREGQAMGTVVTFSAWTTDDAAAEQAFGAAFEEVGRIERLMTDWERPGVPPSDVIRVNQAAGREPVRVSPDTLRVVQVAQDMARRSGGAFDVTFAALHGLWKFDEDLERRIPAASDIAARLRLVAWRDLVVDESVGTLFLRRKGMRMGLGGIAKGFAVDRAAEALRSRGLADFMIQAGGDLLVHGSKGGHPWMVGIKDPRNPDKGSYFAVAPISDHAFSTAGDYERSFVLGGKRYHHILDPKTGYPARASRSVTIWAKTALEADALDDAVFILGPKKGLELVEKTPDAGAVIVDAAGKVWISGRLKGVIQVLSPPSGGT